jgi:transcriptional regulator of met regulon
MQKHFKNIKRYRFKTLKKTQKQLNELRISTNSKVKLRDYFLKKEVYEVKMTTQDIKVEYNKDVKSLRKKNQTEITEVKSPLS